MADTRVDLGFLQLANPIVGASGLFGVETARVSDMRSFGAVVTKTQFTRTRPGNPLTRMVETPAGMLNSVGIPCLGIQHFIDHEWPIWRQIGCPVIVSVGGETPEDYFDVTERLNEVAGIAALEVNISCPNQAAGGLEFGARSADVERVVGGVVARTRLPVIAKLTPNVSRIAEIALAAEAAGSAGLCAINSVLGMSLDIRTRHSRLGTLKGGLSGAAIRPIAVRAVWEVAQVTRLPIIGVGGAETAEDVLEFVLAGASAVGLGTSALYGLDLVARLAGEVNQLLEEIGASSLNELRGSIGSQTRDESVTAG
jgi:dihydroorotate dehydrogenase (NAD+) catalytic subunit